MKGSFIELIIIVALLVFMVQSCSNKTSVSYELGKGFKKIKTEFTKGVNHD